MSVCSSDDDSDSDFGSETGYDESLAAIDFEADLAIEKNIDPADDVGIMVTLSGKSKHYKNQLAQNYWFFICSRIGADISTNEATMTQMDIYKQCSIRFEEAFRSIPLKDMYSEFFRHTQLQWPKCAVDNFQKRKGKS